MTKTNRISNQTFSFRMGTYDKEKVIRDRITRDAKFVQLVHSRMLARIPDSRSDDNVETHFKAF